MKKAHTLVSFMFLLTTSVAAQQTPEISAPPSITVLEMRWYFDLPPLQDSDSIHPRYNQRPTMTDAAVLERREQSLPNQPTEEKMRPPIPIPSRQVTSKDRVYVYSFKIKNNSNKRITRIYWEYQFLDPDTQQLMGTRKVYSDPNLAPGKTRVIKGHSRRQPTIIVAADQLDKKYRDQSTERLIIHRIHYADGTAWQRPYN